jgi:hypothetical protein
MNDVFCDRLGIYNATMLDYVPDLVSKEIHFIQSRNTLLPVLPNSGGSYGKGA